MKILVFGIPGSGKTTFCQRLSDLTSIPPFHIDHHFFEPVPGWVERPAEDFFRDVHEELAKESWIIDGNGMRSLEMRFKEADIAIYLASPLWLCLYRIAHRALLWLVRREKRPLPSQGFRNLITFRFLLYTCRYRNRYRKKIEELQSRYPQVRFIEIRTQKDLDAFFLDWTSRNDDSTVDEE